MKKPGTSSHHYLLIEILLGIIIVLIFSLGTYHLTHRGTRSGITELSFAAAIIAMEVLVIRDSQRRNPGKKFGLYLKIGSVVLSLMAGTLFVLSIYHFTHEGVRSGFTELTMTILLAMVVYLLFLLTEKE
jgi:hypothetical protein